MATAEDSKTPEDLPTDLTTGPSASPGQITLPQDNPHVPTINDFELVNLLYINHLPSVSDLEREKLISLTKTLQSWQKWESAESEQQLVDKVHRKLLPDDHSFASTMKRMAYRAKVMDWLRGDRATWLSKVAVDITQLSETVRKTEAPLAILNKLSHHYIQDGTKFEQLQVVLKPISRLIALGEVGIRQKQFITHTIYKYDSRQKEFVTEIRVDSFYVELSLVEGNADTVKIKYEFTDYILRFDPKRWETMLPGIDDDFLEKGWKVLKQRTLNLAESP